MSDKFTVREHLTALGFKQCDFDDPMSTLLDLADKHEALKLAVHSFIDAVTGNHTRDQVEIIRSLRELYKV